MNHNFDVAAIKATELIIEKGIAFAPIVPMSILKSMPGVLLLSFTEMADCTGLDRKNIVTMYGAENQDAVTLVKEVNGQLRYFVAYNQRLPYYMLQRSLARELGHIVIGHDGSMSPEIRTEEALVFARHLLCPRPLIKAFLESGIDLTVEVFGNVTGCYGRCLAGMRQTPGAHVPAEMNQRVREQFKDFITNYLDFHSIMPNDDDSPIAQFGTYMDNYEE